MVQKFKLEVPEIICSYSNLHIMFLVVLTDNGRNNTNVQILMDRLEKKHNHAWEGFFFFPWSQDEKV